MPYELDFGFLLVRVAAVLGGAAALLVLSLAPAPLVFGQVFERANASRKPPQFGVIDLLVLAAHLQLSVAVIVAFSGAGKFEAVAFDWLACVWLVQLAWWWTAVVWFTRCGIANARARVWLLGIVAPLAFLAGLGIPALLMAVVIFVHTMFLAIIGESISAFVPVLIAGAADLWFIIVCRGSFHESLQRMASED